MKKMSIIALIALGGMGAAHAAPPADPAGTQNPCKQIVAACEAAGFAKGAASAGKQLFKDCVRPIRQGATVAGVTVAAADVQACQAKAEAMKGAQKGAQQACKPVVAACQAAGFAPGKASTGKGLFKDCVKPIREGQTVAGVTLAPADAQACQAARAKPHGFGAKL